LAAERGDLDEMKTAMAKVKVPQNSYVKIANAYLMLADGKTEEVARSMEAYGDENAKEKGWWDRIVGANAYLLAATAYEQLGQPARAIEVLQRTLPIFEDPGINKGSHFKRRLARARMMLARLLAKTSPETAKSLANEALVWYRQAGGYESAIAELEPLTGSR
jgi:tetratricopeptide (TPR) repeat protein